LGASLLLVFGATAWIATTLVSAAQTDLASSISTIFLLMSVKVLMLAAGLGYEVLYWRRPVTEFTQLLQQVRTGTRPAEDLSTIHRGAASLVGPTQELLAEIKTLKSELAELKGEMRQRIASRTDALERKLGAMQAKATRDALTGVSNRRSFDEEFPKIVESCRNARQDLVLMMIDVDHFKTLNDTLGHAAGDELLRSIGQVMRSTIRETDSAYRFGGDEFVLLLPAGDLTSAQALADRLRYLVDGLTKHHRFLDPRPQLSIGIASLVEDAPRNADPNQLLQIADQRLYAIKHARPTPRRRSA
jgi:diguanylate cyclase (GGDEF)-like protein